jgi:hypothetical protein
MPSSLYLLSQFPSQRKITARNSNHKWQGKWVSEKIVPRAEQLEQYNFIANASTRSKDIDFPHGGRLDFSAYGSKTALLEMTGFLFRTSPPQRLGVRGIRADIYLLPTPSSQKRSFLALLSSPQHFNDLTGTKYPDKTQLVLGGFCP